MRAFVVCSAVAFLLTVCGAVSAAEAVWPSGRAGEMNALVSFRADFRTSPDGVAILDIVGWYSYKILLNGRFVAYGPARGPKGKFRKDRISLPVQPGTNSLEILVANYGCKNYYMMKQPPFLMAVVRDASGGVLVETGRDFRASMAPRVQKTPRYSYQRGFTEVYRLPAAEKDTLKLAVLPKPVVLDRLAPYPNYEYNASVSLVSSASVRLDHSRKIPNVRYVSLPNSEVGRAGFSVGDLDVNSFAIGCQLIHENRKPLTTMPLELTEGRSGLYDLGFNDSGFPGLAVRVGKPGRLVLTFDEVLTDGEVSWSTRNPQCCNVVIWDFAEAGDYELETFEPYTMRYLDVAALSGDFRIDAVRFRSYKNATAKRLKFRSSDEDLNRIFEAARETFRQNAVDVLMDCPSRERTGWNCDAYFTSAAATLLTGNAALERLFVENFALAEGFDSFPLGTIPSCYPADAESVFIPNWPMWFALQVEEYLVRSGDRSTVDRLQGAFLSFVEKMRAYRNSDGLLENPRGAIYVGYGRPMSLLKDVNYPTNMLWAEMLNVLARLYSRPDLAREAESVQVKIREQSWTGKWFCDNALRQSDGTLKLSGECTETCQYYAFFFHTATQVSHPELWKTLLKDFGPRRFSPDRSQVYAHPDIWVSDLFVGDFLRMKLLERADLGDQLLMEAKAYLKPMAELTGTFWETHRPIWSCCHGFTSVAAESILNGTIGLQVIDWQARRVVFSPRFSRSVSCDVSIPVEDGEITVACRDGRRKVRVPFGWTVEDPAEAVRFFPKPDEAWLDGVSGGNRLRVESDGTVRISDVATASFARLHWHLPMTQDALVLGGMWERTYGDSGWWRVGDASPRGGSMPWYFLLHQNGRTDGYGVMVQPNAFASWSVGTNGIDLLLDIRAGSSSVSLCGRKLDLCRLVRRIGKSGESAYEAGRAFCQMMCPTPRLPKTSVYGYNDWYCAYGHNTATNFLADAACVVSLLDGDGSVTNRPFLVADDGWQLKEPLDEVSEEGLWIRSNARWNMPMDEFCRRIKGQNARPGLWYRPLMPWRKMSDELKTVSVSREIWNLADFSVDPTASALVELIRRDIARFKSWGIELVKVDFLTFDWNGRWGFEMGDKIITGNCRWRDCSRTTAEVIRGLYSAIREAAGDDMIVIGCNAIDHFAAGLFELQRIGDDTSGKDWERTRRMGPNALGMRAMHNGTFYLADGDCVGLAGEGFVPWDRNRQWLDLVARSGTSLFVSWRRELLRDPEVASCISKALRQASLTRETGEPLDWMEAERPRRWRFSNGEVVTYEWNN